MIRATTIAVIAAIGLVGCGSDSCPEMPTGAKASSIECLPVPKAAVKTGNKRTEFANRANYAVPNWTFQRLVEWYRRALPNYTAWGEDWDFDFFRPTSRGYSKQGTKLRKLDLLILSPREVNLSHPAIAVRQHEGLLSP